MGGAPHAFIRGLVSVAGQVPSFTRDALVLSVTFITNLSSSAHFPFYFNVLFQVHKRSKYLSTFIWLYNIL